MSAVAAMRTGRQRGVALVLVLWLLALLTVMVGGYTATMRTETRLTANHVQSARARALSEAGIWYGIRELLRPEHERRWTLDGRPNALDYGTGEIELRLYDEAGKIDLNTARVELLQNLLASAELDHEEVLRLLHAILDWRDRDNLKRASGAEDDDYEAAGLDYGAKDGPFNSVGELRLVLGMTEAVYQHIAPALTVHSYRPTINPDVAPRRALMALSEDPGVIEEVLATRREGGGDRTDTEGDIPGIDSRYYSRSRSRTVTVASTGKAQDSLYTTEAVILLKPNDTPPFSILSWREGISTKEEEEADES